MIPNKEGPTANFILRGTTRMLAYSLSAQGLPGYGAQLSMRREIIQPGWDAKQKSGEEKLTSPVDMVKYLPY